MKQLDMEVGSALLMLVAMAMATVAQEATEVGGGATKNPLQALRGRGLEFGFYSISCPPADIVISEVVREFFQRDPSIPAGLLRMLFHDCFVQGCDASVLLQSTPQHLAERDAQANVHSLRGFEVIHEIKRRLEQICPATVSCADILVQSTRDAIILAGGPGYSVATGRRDGIASSARFANAILPTPFDSLPVLVARFGAQGFSILDLVALLGGHTVGHSHCRFFARRIYNFTSPEGFDPRLRREFVRSLTHICPPNTAPEFDPVASLDAGSEFTFDNSYYQNLIAGQALLGVDEELLQGPITGRLVRDFAADQALFFRAFASSIMKLGDFRVLTGVAGQIRLNCSVVRTGFL